MLDRIPVYSYEDMMFIAGQLAAELSKVDKADSKRCDIYAWELRNMCETVMFENAYHKEES
jgi:hypothetical protein